MAEAGFRLWDCKTTDGQKKGLLYFVDQSGDYSAPIIGFRTLLNERFNLDPSLGEPFFRIVDSGYYHSFFGSWVGHPVIPENKIVWTGPVIEARTTNGQMIPTWLLTCDTEPVRKKCATAVSGTKIPAKRFH